MGTLQHRPAELALVLAETFRAKKLPLLMQWASLCEACRAEFTASQGTLLERSLRELTTTINCALKEADVAAAQMHYFYGASLGMMDYFHRTLNEALQRKGKDATMPGYIYAIKNARHIKIGFARNLQKRLSQLQVSAVAELELIGALTAYREYEQTVQARFARYRIRGEWYKDCAPIRRFFSGPVLPAQLQGSDGAPTRSRRG